MPPEIDDQAAKIGTLFFARLEHAQAPVQVLFVTDADRKNLLKEPAGPDPLKTFKDQAIGKGYPVLELDEPFRRFLRQGKLALEVGPTDSHWNSPAVKVVADEIAKRIKPQAAALPPDADARPLSSPPNAPGQHKAVR